MFKFGPEARKTVNDEIKFQEKVKTSKEFNYDIATMNVRNLVLYKNILILSIQSKNANM